MTLDPEPRPVACAACEDTGLAAPDPFGDLESWASYLARIERLHEDEGWSLASSAPHCGLINPLPCPLCRPSTINHGEPSDAPRFSLQG
jgi:hypothetical protein